VVHLLLDQSPASNESRHQHAGVVEECDDIGRDADLMRGRVAGVLAPSIDAEALDLLRTFYDTLGLREYRLMLKRIGN